MILLNWYYFLGGEDYEPVVQLILTFNADSVNANFTDIVLLPDDAKEDTETFSVIASSSDPSVSFRLNETVVSILDNDSKNGVYSKWCQLLLC